MDIWGHSAQSVVFSRENKKNTSMKVAKHNIKLAFTNLSMQEIIHANWSCWIYFWCQQIKLSSQPDVPDSSVSLPVFAA